MTTRSAAAAFKNATPCSEDLILSQRSGTSEHFAGAATQVEPRLHPAEDDVPAPALPPPTGTTTGFLDYPRQQIQWRPQPNDSDKPLFHGTLYDDPEEFLEGIRGYMDAVGLDTDAARRHSFGAALRDRAAEWHKENRRFFDYEDLVRSFRRYFSSARVMRDVRSELDNAVQPRVRSAESFARDQATLWRRLAGDHPLPEEAVVRGTIARLRKEYAGYVYLPGEATFAAAIEACGEADQRMADNEPCRQAPITKNAPPPAKTSTSHGDQQQQQRQQEAPRCWYCPGRHFNRDCPNRPEDADSRGGGRNDRSGGRGNRSNPDSGEGSRDRPGNRPTEE